MIRDRTKNKEREEEAQAFPKSISIKHTEKKKK
jgi:hypothetical protein